MIFVTDFYVETNENIKINWIENKEIKGPYIHTGSQKKFNPGIRVRREEAQGNGFYAGVTLFAKAYCVVVVVQVGVVVEGHEGPEVFVVEKSGWKLLILKAFGA